MIAGKISNLAADRKWLPVALVKGLDYIQNTDFSKIEVGKYEVDGTKIYALVQEYETSPKEQKKAETHVKYLDIQYIAAGVEALGFAPLGPEQEIKENLAELKDGIFYSNVKNESEIILKQGEYAIFFPEDVHRPGCLVGTSAPVKKVVLKVAVDLL